MLFSFRLSLFGFATARLLPPHHSVNHILLHNTHTLHILPHHIQPPLPRPSPFPSSRHLHLQCPSPYILRFSPFHMSVPPQPCSSNLLPQLSYFRRPSDILIPDLIFSCHPRAHLNIFNSATSNFPTCLSVTATVSIPYIIAGLTTHLYIIPFTLADSFLSHSTPEIFLQLSHPA